MNKKWSLGLFIVCSGILVATMLRWQIFSVDIQGRHTWKQSQTALNIRNFTRHDLNIFNPRVGHFNIDECNIYRAEFPLMQWAIGLAQRVLGEDVRIMRLSVFLISLLTLLGVFKLCFLLTSDWIVAGIATVIFQFIPLYLHHSINILPDNLALCLSIWMLFTFFKTVYSGDLKWLKISYLLLSLAALVKLPFIIFGIVYVKYIVNRFSSWRSYIKEIFILSVFLLPVALWYGWSIPDWEGNRISLGIFDSEIGHDRYIEFLSAQLTEMIPFIVIGVGLITPFALGTISSLSHASRKMEWPAYGLLGLITSILYFLFILKQIEDGHDYYFYPFLPWIILLALACLSHFKKYWTPIKIVLILSLLAHPIMSWNEVKVRWDHYHAFFNKDFFTYRKHLQDAVPHSEMCIMLNDNSRYMIPYVTDKFGYVFSNDGLQPGWIADMIENKNVRFMYSDTRRIDESEDHMVYFDETIAQYGSVKVIRLISKEDLLKME